MAGKRRYSGSSYRSAKRRRYGGRPYYRSYKRRSYRPRRSRLSKAAWLYGKAFDNVKRKKRLAESLQEISGGRLHPNFDEGTYAQSYFDKAVGRGKYSFGKFRKSAAGRAIGKGAAIAAEAYTGLPIRELAGTGMYTGSGMYTGPPESNHLVEGGTDGAPPQFASGMDEEGALRVTHSEFVRDIYGNDTSVNFANQSLRLNPGLADTFPWLSQIACNYEEYELIQLMFYFESKISDQLGGTNGQVGSIIMFTDYGADSKVKTSKQQMLQGYGSQDSVVTKNAIHGIECDPAKIHGDGHKYIRVRPLEDNQALTDYDLGIFQLAVSGTPDTLANEIIGQLYVSYTVLLRKPRLYSLLGLNIQKDEFINASDGDTNDKNMFPFPVLTGDDNSIGCLFEQTEAPVAETTNQKAKITFPASFSGAVEVIIAVEFDDDGAGSNANVQDLVSAIYVENNLTGNVTVLSDMYVRGSSTSTDETDDPIWYHQWCATTGGMARMHFQVEMAESGIDNSIELQFTDKQPNPANPTVRAQLTVQRYNNTRS